MKALQYFTLYLVMTVTGIAQLDAMKRAWSDSDSNDVQVSKKQKTDHVNQEEQENRPIGIIINHLGKEKGFAMNLTLEHFLNDEFILDDHHKPIIMVSPDVVDDLLNDLDKRYNDRPFHNYEGKTTSVVRNPRPNGEFDCMNYFEKLLEEVIFLDDPNNHFVMIFPNVYKDYLSHYTLRTLSTAQDLRKLIANKPEHPCKKDFQTLAKICTTINGVSFKALIAGHGCTDKKPYSYLPNEQLSLICNLFPKDCSDMLQAFNGTNITTIALSTCCVGGANRYFLENKPNDSSIPLYARLCPWVETTYSFHLVIHGITDFGTPNHGFKEKFLNAGLYMHTSPEDIVSYLTTDGDYGVVILQILPAGQKNFKTYDRGDGNPAIIGQQKSQQDYNFTNAKNILIYANITEPIIFSDSIPALYFMAHNTTHYQFETISLQSTERGLNTGILNFIQKAFWRAGSAEFPKTILIKNLVGKNDIHATLEEGKMPTYESSYGFLNYDYQALETILLTDVMITASDKVVFSFMYNGKHYTNQTKQEYSITLPCIIQ